MLCAGINAFAADVSPANPQTNDRARAILKYLTELEARTEKRMLSGQFTDFGANGNLSILERIHERTGHWPALAGFDYVDFPNGGLTTKIPNQSAIEYWRGGGLITVGVHLYNPANPKGGGLRDKGVNLNDLLDPSSPTHARWMKELDELAAGLQELARRSAVSLGSTTLVGDSPIDLQTARSAGSHIVLAGYGFGFRPVELLDGERIAGRPAELANLF